MYEAYLREQERKGLQRLIKIGEAGGSNANAPRLYWMLIVAHGSLLLNTEVARMFNTQQGGRQLTGLRKSKNWWMRTTLTNTVMFLRQDGLCV